MVINPLHNLVIITITMIQCRLKLIMTRNARFAPDPSLFLGGGQVEMLDTRKVRYVKPAAS